MSWLTQGFTKRGYPLIDRRNRDAGKVAVMKFKGRRGAVTTVTGNKYGVYGSTDEIGSVFYALVSADAAGSLVKVYGKPTANGKEACDDHDAQNFVDVDACENLVAGIEWSGRAQMSGREESEVIRGVLVSLEALPQDQPRESPPTPTTSL